VFFVLQGLETLSIHAYVLTLFFSMVNQISRLLVGPRGQNPFAVEENDDK